MYIEKINSPYDLKQMNVSELNMLASEIRAALLKKLSICGGHFGPNFGMVEATIALHYVFNSPVDKIVFDVSHQCYTHKILTGRKDAFLYEEHYKDVSGFTSPAESEHDLFTVGHTSTSLSLASGLAKARDVSKGSENIIAVIGDGSLGGGEALEGLNFAAELGTNFIIVVNDNDMSIAENHGGLYSNLKQLRDSNGKCELNLFKSFGLDYVYEAEGNNIEKLIEVFSSVKDISHPIVVHICTQKGKGYACSEKNKEDWHFCAPFNLQNGSFINSNTKLGYDALTAEYLIKKMQDDEKVVTVVAGVPKNIGFNKERRERAGNRFIDVGIAEEHAVAFVSGIAKNGGKPVFATHSSFMQRTFDQLSQDLCINKSPATILVNSASIFGMKDITHLGIFDIPLISHIPNIVYLAPTSKDEYFAMLDWSIDQNEYPVAIRVPYNGVVTDNREVQKDYSNLNKFKVEISGSKIAIIAVGDFYQLGENIVEEIEKTFGICATLINPRYLSGLDKDLLEKLKENHSLVITLEDGILEGGFGESIASYYGTSKMLVKNYGFKKEFIDRFDPEKVLQDNGITTKQIIIDIKNLLGL